MQGTSVMYCTGIEQEESSSDTVKGSGVFEDV